METRNTFEPCMCLFYNFYAFNKLFLQDSGVAVLGCEEVGLGERERGGFRREREGGLGRDGVGLGGEGVGLVSEGWV